MDSFKTLSIIIPAYNEAKTIHLILDRVHTVDLIHNLQKEIILVDDCSTDGTEEVLLNYKVAHPGMNMQYYKHEVNQGKGAAIHTGIKKATGEYLVIQDADLEYDPEEFNKLLKPVIRGSADVVFGSRFLGGNPHRILFYWHSIGNKVLTRLSNMLTNLNLTDMETCYKLCKTQIILARIPEIRIYEVGISYYGRTYLEGKKIGWKDGFHAIYCILKYNLFR
jgi:glycosyltransferase involved in cell wall biosynthesis